MKAIVKEAAKYAGISTGIALGIFCFVGMLFDLYYGGNFSLSGYQFTKMVIGCVLVGALAFRLRFTGKKICRCRSKS